MLGAHPLVYYIIRSGLISATSQKPKVIWYSSVHIITTVYRTDLEQFYKNLLYFIHTPIVKFWVSITVMYTNH